MERERLRKAVQAEEGAEKCGALWLYSSIYDGR